MDMKRYIISDAASLVNVESHVLRYWEEELELNIPRNELGHRYYTEENIAQFMKIKELKEQGYQLKAIKILVHNQEGERELEQEMNRNWGEGQNRNMTSQNMNPQNMNPQNMNPQSMDRPFQAVQQPSQITQYKQPQSVQQPQAGIPQMQPNQMQANQIQQIPQPQQDNAHNVERFQMMMSSIVKNAIQENSVALGREVTSQVGEKVLKEMNYLMRMQDEQEEERYHKLDEAIRTRQKKRRFRKEKIKKADVKKSNKRFRKENVLDPKPNL